MVSFISISFEE